MAVVTISHELGARGPAIGRGLAERLGYRFVDRDIVSEAAQRYGLVEDRVCHFDETRPSFLERFEIETRRYLAVLRVVLYGFAEAGDAVLMGRGGQWLLRGIPHVLRVRVVAPFDTRVARLREGFSGEADRRLESRGVAHMVRQSDAEKLGRMRYLYEVDLRDPLLYDLTIDDDALAADTVADLLGSLVRRPEFSVTAMGRGLLADRSLASRVELALLSGPATRGHRILVEAEQGVVTLDGTSDLEGAVELARRVPGVTDVRVRELQVPIPTFL